MQRVLCIALLASVVAAISATSVSGFGPLYYVSLNSVDDSWVSSTCLNTPSYPPLTATGTSSGANELFTIEDLNGGELVDGDEILFRCAGNEGRNSAGLSVYTSETPVYMDEAFPNNYDDAHWYLEDTDCASSGCEIISGHKLHFKNKATGRYLYAVGGGGGNVNGDASSPGSYGRFEIIF